MAGALILFLFTWILFKPVSIRVDTDCGDYRISQAGTVSFWLDQDYRPRMSLIGIPFSPPIRGKEKKQKHEPEVRPRRKRKPFSPRKLYTLVRRIIRALTIKRLIVDLDTDDVVLNAYMTPVFMAVSHGAVSLSANHTGRMRAILHAEIRVYRLVWAFLLFYTIKHQ